jgi:hypothetical protein
MLQASNREGRLSLARSRVGGMGPRSSVRTTPDMSQEYESHKLSLRVIAIAISVVFLVLALIGIFPRQRNRLLQMTRPRRAQNSKPGIIALKPGESLQVAIDDAVPGDTIILQAGEIYTANVTLPKKNGDGYVTIQSSRAGELPENTRITPKQVGLLAKLQSTVKGAPVIKTAPGAHHYKFIGVEISTANATLPVFTLVELGSAYKEQNTLETVPHDLVFDRCYIHGFPLQPVQRGVALNSAETSVLNSWISDIHWDIDTQALCGWNGPGPFHIINNHLEAASENVMFGGATVHIPNMIPSDIEIRGNHFFKPLSWKLGDPAYVSPPWRSNTTYGGYSVKNLFELKNAQRVIIDGNLFENSWGDAQTGFAIILTPRQDPYAVIQDLTITNNVFRNVNGGVDLMGVDSYSPGTARQQRVLIANNLFQSVGTEPLFQINGIIALTIDHNTAIHRGNIITAYSQPSSRFIFTNNIVEQNQYGMATDGAVPLSHFFPGGVIRKNLIVGGSSGYADNFTPANLDDVKFIDAARRNYGLQAGSPFKNKGTDNRDAGCDFALLRRALSAQ